MFLYAIFGRRREMGHGGVTSFSLKDARALAAEYKSMVIRAIDPIERRNTNRRDAVGDRSLLVDVARQAFESRKAELKGDGNAGSGSDRWSCMFCPRSEKCRLLRFRSKKSKQRWNRYGMAKRRLR